LLTFSLVVVVTMFTLITQPSLVEDVVNRIASSLGGSASNLVGSSSDSCAQVRAAFSGIGDCSPSSSGGTKPGYQWCLVTLRNGGGDDWNLNGTNMSMGSQGEAWVPNECVP
jgi:hypothetical protein